MKEKSTTMFSPRNGGLKTYKTFLGNGSTVFHLARVIARCELFREERDEENGVAGRKGRWHRGA